jgi:hypothetical protein
MLERGYDDAKAPSLQHWERGFGGEGKSGDGFLPYGVIWIEAALTIARK